MSRSRFENKPPSISDNRLTELVTQARLEGYDDREIAEELGTSVQRIVRVVGEPED